MRPFLLSALPAALVLCALPFESPADAPRESSRAPGGERWPERISTEHLPNAVEIHPKVISGGEPEGDAGFAELRKLGVKTVISVDGARPHVEAARRHGLKYIHLPHGYDGIPRRRARELAKAVRDEEGSVYIHCHHGKHRSPAAAGVACVAAGLVAPAQALAVLQVAGTSPNYRGLYQSAEEAAPLDPSLLDGLQIEFRETADVPPLAEAMVAIERVHDHLQQIAAAGWRTPQDHPDLDPAHQALLLREHFAELLRAGDAREMPAGFRKLVGESENTAEELEHGLRGWSRDGHDAPAPASVRRAADRISASCKACHARYRDVPLGEKR